MAGGKPRKQFNAPSPVFSGYIAIPQDVERDSFVESCMRRGRVSVIQEGGVFMNDIYITNEALQNIHFPEKPGEQGTLVMIVSSPFRNLPVVIGTLNANDESPAWSEDIFRFKKNIGKVQSLMEINPKDNSIVINIDSIDPVSIKLNSTGSTESLIELFASGSISATADVSVKAKSYGTIEAQIVNTESKDSITKEERSVVMGIEALTVTRKTNDKTSTIILDDNQIDLNYLDSEENVHIDSDKILISYNKGEESVELKKDYVNLKTAKYVYANGGKEPLTLANSLIQDIQQLQNQITLLKNAWQTAASSAVPQDGGKTGLTAGMASVASISPVDFNNVKSTVTFSD